MLPGLTWREEWGATPALGLVTPFAITALMESRKQQTRDQTGPHTRRAHTSAAGGHVHKLHTGLTVTGWAPGWAMDGQRHEDHSSASCLLKRGYPEAGLRNRVTVPGPPAHSSPL